MGYKYHPFRKRIRYEQQCSPISIIIDDVLLEILVRLPDFKSVVECTYVCKQWRSIILASITYFSCRFNHHHRQKRLRNNLLSPPMPFSLLFSSSFSWTPSSCLSFFSERSKIFDYEKRLALEFLPCKDDVNEYAYILSSFEDLLLIKIHPKLALYVCNPFTSYSIALPTPPNFNNARCRYALVVSGYDGASNKLNNPTIKVVMITTDLTPPTFILQLAIFSFETGKWTELTFECPHYRPLSHNQAIASNDIVYWPYGTGNKIEGMVALNIFSRKCRSINLSRVLGRLHCSIVRQVNIGVVRGKLRLSQFFWNKKNQSFVFKAWDLDDNGERCIWNLVHYHDEMTMNSKYCLRVNELSFLTFHPDDGDVFFFSCYGYKVKDKVEIFKCRIVGENHNKIDSLCHLSVHPKVRPRLPVVSLLLPWWPTQLISFS
ncbi:hypothetical protein CsatB_028229 [Cannabis sativa]